MLTLADDAIPQVVTRSVEILGPIGAFIVLAAAALIVLYKVMIAPELKSMRETTKDTVSKHESIAQANAVTTTNLKDLSVNMLKSQEAIARDHVHVTAQRDFLGKLIDDKTGK